MKAESIEQIREHLARGGRVVSGDNEIMEVTQKWIIGFAVSYHISDKPLDYHDFELLPLEEKEPEIKLDKKPHYSETENGGFTIEWEQNGRCVKLYVGRGYMFRSGTGGEGTGEVFHFDALLNNREEAAERLGAWLEWLEEREPVRWEEQPRADYTMEAMEKEFNERLYGKPVRQYFYRVNGCLAEDASSEACICWHDEGTGPLKDKPERVHDWREKPVDHGTQKGQEEEYIEAERAVHIPVPCEMRLNKRIRTRLLHGQWPEMSDLLSWWEATTGERIEWGKRCERCDGQSYVVMKKPWGNLKMECSECENGYSVRPTWMDRE